VNRTLPIVVISLFLFPLCAQAQQQDKKLMDRIQRPDMQLGSPLQTKSFAGAQDLKIQSSAASNKTFGVAEASNLKVFQGSRSFFGIKNPWFGQRTYDAKTADLTSRGGAEIAKSYRVKETAVSSYSASARKANPSAAEVPLKPFLVPGEAQGAMQQISDKVRKEMTIDDVRELLNKPR